MVQNGRVFQVSYLDHHNQDILVDKGMMNSYEQIYNLGKQQRMQE